MIQAGSVCQLSREGMREWKGGVHYLPHFGVHNPESASTALRVVMDSRCRNQHSGISFNNLVRPVPNALNDITDVQLWWRCLPVSLSYNLSKAYHALVTGDAELLLRRFLLARDGRGMKGLRVHSSGLRGPAGLGAGQGVGGRDGRLAGPHGSQAASAE